MRLIDADKITFFDCLAKTENSVCCHTEGIVSKTGIDMQPTVKAIPIDWIKQWINERNDFPTMPYNQHILNMIEDWEKENGISQ